MFYIKHLLTFFLLAAFSLLSAQNQPHSANHKGTKNVKKSYGFLITTFPNRRLDFVYKKP